ncbi:MAG: TRAP transporter substrate-binding protein DctP [Bowdeniella nasicola]|nr:TRAP transporter substrate-binding protein DctP [Bowdeniella nasicola]
MKRTHAPYLATLAAATLALSACGGGGIVEENSTEGSGSSSSEEGGASGEKVTLNMVTMVQPNVPNAPVQNWFLDELEARSDGRIEIKRTEPGSICKAAEIAECVKDGRADIGISVSEYTPQLFPSMSIATIPFMADNSQAFMQAMDKVNHENADAVAAWEASGLTLMASWTPGNMVMGSNVEITSVKDLDGMRFRVVGAYLQQAFEKAGTNVVALTAPETYEGIERGLADAAAWVMDGAVDYKLMEQLKHWTAPGTGTYTTFAIWLNTDVYNAMPDDLKQIVEETRMDLINGEGMKAFNGATEVQCDQMLAFEGVESFTKWDEAATEEWKAMVQDDLIEAWKKQAESDGLNNPQGYLEDYLAAYEEFAAQPDIVDDPVTACVKRFEER